MGEHGVSFEDWRCLRSLESAVIPADGLIPLKVRTRGVEVDETVWSVGAHGDFHKFLFTFDLLLN